MPYEVVTDKVDGASSASDSSVHAAYSDELAGGWLSEDDYYGAVDEFDAGVQNLTHDLHIGPSSSASNLQQCTREKSMKFAMAQ